MAISRSRSLFLLPFLPLPLHHCHCTIAMPSSDRRCALRFLLVNCCSLLSSVVVSLRNRFVTKYSYVTASYVCPSPIKSKSNCLSNSRFFHHTHCCLPMYPVHNLQLATNEEKQTSAVKWRKELEQSDVRTVKEPSTIRAGVCHGASLLCFAGLVLSRCTNMSGSIGINTTTSRHQHIMLPISHTQKRYII